MILKNFIKIKKHKFKKVKIKKIYKFNKVTLIIMNKFNKSDLFHNSNPEKLKQNPML